ncbi:hypothetical protein ACNJX9_32915 [Bradyrhizobium sp. DASA03076]|uniref:hypothetical protein n=1 Tax=Bradyrhizobium sp. BLXBL-03 TaxID=3395916 RepID=UPI003F72F901
MKIASQTMRLAQACKPVQQALDASRQAAVAGQRLLLAGSDGERISSAAGGTAKLANQVARSIDSSATAEVCFRTRRDPRAGSGPGHTLAERMQAVRSSTRCCAADVFRIIAGLRKWIASA